MDNLKLAELLFKDLDLTVADIEKKYPPRELPAGAMVTRIAPSAKKSTKFTPAN